MINAVFTVSNGNFIGFEVSGHAGYGESGSDIVCACVSSALQLTANAITDSFHAKADVSIDDMNRIALQMQGENEAASTLIGAFYQHLELLSQDYKNTIKLTISEV